MKPTGFVLMGGLVLTGAGCASSSPTAAADEAPLVGRWSWVESFGGIAGMHPTPASTGIERELRFRSDGVAELLVDGRREGRGGYAVEEGSPGGPFEGGDVVRWAVPLLGGWEEQGLRFPHADTLVLTDPCCDGYVWTFARAGS